MTVYTFDTADAEKYGSADLATLLQNLRFWLRKNQANEKNIHDGRVWTYNSQEAWVKLFPWFSVSQIGRLLKKLEKAGILLKGNYNADKFNKTVWYSINEDEFRTNALEAPEPPIIRNRSIDKLISNPHPSISQHVTDSKQQINNNNKTPVTRESLKIPLNTFVEKVDDHLKGSKVPVWFITCKSEELHEQYDKPSAAMAVKIILKDWASVGR